MTSRAMRNSRPPKAIILFWGKRAALAIDELEAAGAVETMEPPVPQFPQRYDYYEVEPKRTDERFRRAS